MTHPVKQISISIDRPVSRVYEYASNPENFPRWVAFIESITLQTDGSWIAESDLGNINIRFTPENKFGIMDHLVTLPDGSAVNNPMRVVENGTGNELTFTLFWMPGRTEEEFDHDAELVEADLKKVKELLESE